LVPCEFIDDEATPRPHEAADLVEDNAEAANMVQREAGHCDIETSVLVEIFDPTLAEDQTLRRPRIDRDDVVASALQSTRQPAVAASDFEDPSRRRWEL